MAGYYSVRCSWRTHKNPEPNDRQLFANLQCLYTGSGRVFIIRCEIRENAKYLARFKGKALGTRSRGAGISWRETGFDCYSGRGIHQNYGTGCGIFSPWLSGIHDDSNTQKALDNIELNQMNYRYVSSVLQNDWNDPVDFRSPSIDRSEDVLFELLWVIKRSILSFPVLYITKKDC